MLNAGFLALISIHYLSPFHMRFLIVAGIAALTLSSCSISKEPRETPNPPFAISKNKNLTPLLVFSFQHHTGIVLPRKAVESELPELTTELSGAWLEFGWGDEGFYRSEEVTLSLAFRALAYPTPSVMHIATSARPLHYDYAYTPAHIFHITDKQRKILVQRIALQFSRDEKGNLQLLGSGRYGESRFYRACHRFFFPRTCNAWTADHLRAIGYQVRAVTAPGLFKELEKLTNEVDSPSLQNLISP
jgi:uncharacterized protein (TIGR02117 family)